MRWSLKYIKDNDEEWSPLLVETQSLIIIGPYHYTRNPIFISFVIFYMALFIFLNNLWGFVMVILLIKLLNKYIIIPRENTFLEVYGETYEDYHAKTGRWL
jgi:protein-S-isoprenylcysteine O-methyltransferase Ste14